MKIQTVTSTCLALLASTDLITAFSFGTRLNDNVSKTGSVRRNFFSSRKQFSQVTTPRNTNFATNEKYYSTCLSASVLNDDGDGDGALTINPIYAGMWAALLGFAIFLAPGEFNGQVDTDMINQIIANPTNPGLNEIFMVIFNFFVVAPITLACLLMPGAKGQKFPATPFVAGSAFVGFFALGPYLTTRQQKTDVTKEDLGWFTSTVLENKLANYAALAIAVSIPFTTGVLSADPASTIDGFVELVTSSKFAAVSTADLTLLTIVSAMLIPEDMERRGMTDDGSSSDAKLLAASTLLLPVIGGSLYCALRPELEEV